MKSRIAIIVSITLVIGAVYAGYRNQLERWNRPLSGAPVAVLPAIETQALVQWAFEDLEGRQRHMSEWAGKLIIVNFWATWCHPCRKEIPGFIALQERYAHAGVQFIGIAYDRAEAVSAFAAEQGINYPILIGEQDVARYMRALGNAIGALPFSAVISRDGRVLATHQGEWRAEDVASVISAAL